MKTVLQRSLQVPLKAQPRGNISQMDRKSMYPALALILFSMSGLTMAQPAEAVVVSRNACAASSTACHSAYTFADVQAFVKIIERHADHAPSRAYIERPIQLGPSDLRSRDILNFNASGELTGIWSRYRRKINGIGVLNKTEYKVHPGGAIKAIRLSFPQWIDGRYYPAYTNLQFDNRGRITVEDFYSRMGEKKDNTQALYPGKYFLESSMTLGKITLPEGTLVEQDADRISMAHLSEATDVCGITLQYESLFFTYYRDGSFSVSLRLNENRLIHGLPLKRTDESTGFFEDCSLSSAILASPITRHGFPLAAGKRFRLSRNGDVLQGILGKSFSYKGLQIPAGVGVRFDTPLTAGPMLFGSGTVTDGDRVYKAAFMQVHDNGVIAYGVLKQSAIIDGKKFPANTRLSFTRSRKLLDVGLP